MGTVTIHDDVRTRQYRLRRLDGDHRVRVRWPSQAAPPGDGAPPPTSTDAASTDGRTADSRTTDGPTTARRRGHGPGAPGDTDDAATWLAVAPFALTVVGLLVGAVYGFGVFDTGTSGRVELLPYAALVPYFLTALAGTLWLFRDADRLARADAAWQPNPSLYVLGGASVLELYYLAPVLAGDVAVRVVPYLAGGFVLAALLSSVVAGPVYVLLRRRNLGAASRDGEGGVRE
ncbi:MAG: hypothetical protein ABEJ88_04395 [Halobacterium sp.]